MKLGVCVISLAPTQINSLWSIFLSWGNA